MGPIRLLVTLDNNYLQPLRVLLTSLFFNNPQEKFFIYMMYDGIGQADRDCLQQFCQLHNSRMHFLPVEDEMFAEAPVFRHYTRAMYYRLLAYEMLPSEVERILYLDPDILALNSVRSLYDLDMGEQMFAGAMHMGLTGLSGQVNKIRLKSYESQGYYNSGVLLMNVAAQRQKMDRRDIFAYVQEHKNELILPDQDILNGLYGPEIVPLDDSIYNYDARHYQGYYLLSGGEKDIDWILENTVFLHFCGKNKPWQESCHNRFRLLYKQYAKMERIYSDPSFWKRAASK